MKKHLLLPILTFALFACQFSEKPAAPVAQLPPTPGEPQPVPKQDVKTLGIGATAPDFNLPGVDGKYYTLQDFKDAKALVIIFTCNHCPTAQAYEDRVIALAADYKDKGVAVVAISPNSPLGLLPEELGYTDLNDDYESGKLRAAYKQFNFPYLYDGDTETASLQYGPVATPHAFVFDASRKLRYTGRLDQSEKPGTANAEDARAAIDAVLNGGVIAEPVTKTFGCSTKWGWKSEMRTDADQEWAKKEVTLAKADVAGIKKVLKNEDSKKLRLVNVWATWCGPCILEYPEFVEIQRMYGARDFEFASISADKPEQEEKVLEFLKSKHSAVANYLFSESNKYALVEAVDTNWNGALPYTILVEPGGKVVWSHQGDVDFLALKRAIVEHAMMGRYY
ncbi:MAG TPA: redoxin family protein [Saprospiraceae bacterium]|nr:redoxin family protein [Saprospiraceae bacterium]